MAHIRSYNPVVSHYQRHNAPNRMYLPRTLTSIDMYEEFKALNADEEQTCCLSTYQSVVREMGISFKDRSKY